jgi:CRISPR/Cas system-associated exonuclease Cas4 (RecB family)
MELAYPEGERISADFIRNRLKDTERLVEVAIQEMYGKPVTFGHDFLMKGVLIQLVEAILKFDLKEPDFLLMGNELKVHSSVQLDDGSSFLLKGSIDRLERTQNGIRVLDYKTGSDVIDKETFDFIFNDKKVKTAFQLYFYALLVHKGYESTEPIRSAIMKLKTKEVLYINNGEPITASEIEAFEAGVRELIADIMNPAIPFTMTEEIQNCKYCDFKVLCQRTEA